MSVEQQVEIAGRHRPALPAGESFTDLLKRLSGEGSELLRGEIALAKLELKEDAGRLARDAAEVIVAVALAAVGGLALMTCIILLLGLALGGAYWASTLIVGIVFLAAAAVLGNHGLKRLRRANLKPEETIETLHEDGAWVLQEARELKEKLFHTSRISTTPGGGVPITSQVKPAAAGAPAPTPQVSTTRAGRAAITRE